MSRSPCFINAAGVVCAAGRSPAEALATLDAQVDCLTRTDIYGSQGALPLGLCRSSELPCLDQFEPRWHSRNNQLVYAALMQIKPQIDEAILRYGAHRIAVVIGTSTSGVADNEWPMRRSLEQQQLQADLIYPRQEMSAPADFVAHVCATTGPVYGISTACTSGAKALASARRLIRAGFCDAVIAGGADSIASLTVNGFAALEAISSERCKPFSADRSGINIGEGAGLFLLSRDHASQGENPALSTVELTGVGECSDAYHISAPDPSGVGAMRAMQSALTDAAISAERIGYINLHGTATQLNDVMEAKAVNALFGKSTPCSSTKPYTGHALGASGAIEAAICWQLLQTPAENPVLLPAQYPEAQIAADLMPIGLVTSNQRCRVDAVMTNSFAFGGNNIALILERQHD